MKTAAIAAAVLALLATTALPADAQRDVTRRNYAFLDRHLTIEVLADAPGVLHIVRGSPGRLEVVARATGGFAGFGLAGHTRDRLHLDAVGAERAEYMVIVPEHVRVRVQLPGQPGELASHEPSARFQWAGVRPGIAPVRNGPYSNGPFLNGPAMNGAALNRAVGDDATAAERAVAAGAAATMVPLSYVERDALPLTYHARQAPLSLQLVEPHAVRTLEVRVAGDDFRIATSRPLMRRSGQQDHLELRLGGEPIDVVVYVPTHTGNFTLIVGDKQAITMRNGAVTTGCTPVTMQRLATEDRFTFSPTRAPLVCQ